MIPLENPEGLVRMSSNWQELTKLTQGQPLIVERVVLVDKDIAIEGRFELPPMDRLTAEDQVFVAAFIRCHGSIKQMEEFFGVSYPTIKNRLNRIGSQLEFVEIGLGPSGPRAADVDDILTRLEAGELTVEGAMGLLGQ
jgi:hypothetical protein